MYIGERRASGKDAKRAKDRIVRAEEMIFIELPRAYAKCG
jgi:hypothetical protein